MTGRATNIAYIGPSVTPYDNLNPGYRIYYVDGDHDATTRLVIDHENWIMNLKVCTRVNNERLIAFFFDNYHSNKYLLFMIQGGKLI